MSWRPDQQTQEAVRNMVDALFAVAPDVLGIDEFIAGCEVMDMDLYGVGVGVYPRYIQCDIRGYMQPVFYRGGLATLAVGDAVTVVHIRDGELYEVAGPSGATGTAGLTGTGANTQVTHWTGPTTIAGDAGMTYNAGTNTLTLAGGLTLTGGATAVLTLNDNVANAHTVIDAGATEYLRYITTDAQPVVVWNNGEADVDFRVAASGATNALFIRGSDGLVSIAENLGINVTPGQRLDIAESANATVCRITSYSVTNGNEPAFNMRKSSTNTIGTPQVTAANEDLGIFRFQGCNTAPAFVNGAYMLVEQEGAAGAAFIGARIQFYTGTNAAGTTRKLTISSTGDVGIGSLAFPTVNGGMVLYFGDNTADPTMAVNTAGFYGKDVAGTVEAFCVDEAGNATQLSPHDPETGEWVFLSRNVRTGREVRVNMEKMVREIERLSGKQFLFEEVVQ